MKREKSTDARQYLNYQNLFFLFMIGNVMGCLLEGIWTVYKFGRWESHVNTIWGPFCLIYGVGTVVFYITGVFIHKENIVIKFLIFALVSDAIEYFCAWLLEEGLEMRAWTYKKQFLNLQGRISLEITILWGIVGIVYFYLLMPRINALFRRIQGKFWRKACIVLTIFMAANMIVTVFCLARWSERHNGKIASNQLEQALDRKYDDDWMKKRFCEWWFINEENEFWQDYKNR
ncbi:MAG: putative ABC transporter permease [bacterium]|nr:putative ABC transporter permease [bacterium]